MTSAALPYKKQRRQVLGREMAYLEVGEGTPSSCCTAELTVKGIHFIQEDSPDEIGKAIARWIKSLA